MEHGRLRSPSVASLSVAPKRRESANTLVTTLNSSNESTKAAPPLRSAVVRDSAAASGLGVELEAAEAKTVREVDGQVVEHSQVGAISRSATAHMPPDYSIAPAAILPRFAGEPLRADLIWPPQPRGTGEVWPIEARIEAGETTGRFPLAYAWHMLATRQLWTWRTGGDDGRETQVTAADAIAQALAALRPALPRAEGRGEGRAGITSGSRGGTTTTGALASTVSPRERGPEPMTLIVPNHLGEASQQELLDAGASHHLNLSFLPRPIAAAMAWCEKFAAELDIDRIDAEKPIGSIAVLHFGLDLWEVTTVDIFAAQSNGRTHFIPARRRKVLDPLPSYGVELLHRLAIRSLEMSYQQMNAARVWELVWCTPWLKAALSLLSDGSDPFPTVVALAKHVRGGEFLKQQCRQATQRIFRAVEPVPGLLRQCLGKTPQFTDIRDWFTERKKAAPPEGFLGAVITGPMAGMPCEKEAVGMHHLLKMWSSPKRVLVEGKDVPRGLLARGAAKHAAFIRQSEHGEDAASPPTYLESLPRVRIAAAVEGQATWVDLLDDVPTHVAGGVAVKRPRPLTGFPIKADTTRFKIAVHHEDWPTAHIATARLPQVLSQAEPVTLHAALRPMHGFPVIELVPVHEGLFGRHRVLVDMRTMKDTGKTPDEFLKAVGG